MSINSKMINDRADTKQKAKVHKKVIDSIITWALYLFNYFHMPIVSTTGMKMEIFSKYFVQLNSIHHKFITIL
jgi:hypothetical protein